MTSLARVDQSANQGSINTACYWLGVTQDISGGWVYSSSGNHYPEIGGEATAALSFGQNLFTDEPPEVWVDDDYTTSWTDGHLWGYDAFDNIQDGVDAVMDAGTVHVAAGTYTEAVLIEKRVIMLGATAGVNKNGYTVPSGYAWDDAVESIINHPDPSGGYSPSLTFTMLVTSRLTGLLFRNSTRWAT